MDIIDFCMNIVLIVIAIFVIELLILFNISFIAQCSKTKNHESAENNKNELRGEKQNEKV